MELRKLSLVLLLIVSISLEDVSARSMFRQRREHQHRPQNITAQRNMVELNLSYDFSVHRETFRISFVVILPETIPGRQNILGIKYSPKPTRIFNKNGNRYAEFVFTKPDRQEKVEINIKAELFRYDLLTAREQDGKNRYEDTGLKDFLKHEKYIEKDHAEIQQIAESIDGQTQRDIVKNIYNYVIDNMEYTTHKDKDWGAVKALQLKKGDCTEYSDLFVALCRAKNIPARFAAGYTLRFDDISPKHNWVEVFLQDYGWVPFDPSCGDVKNFILRDRAFSRMRPVYMYLNHIRNDEVINNSHFAGYKYWGDRARVKDSIEFKRISPTFPKAR
ncbi:MAG: transglutaminase domain-containing protein [Planctomycetes bacterium]|nr:transglutaminase domain-containing protein [Planctomycetota bacterium]